MSALATRLFGCTYTFDANVLTKLVISITTQERSFKQKNVPFIHDALLTHLATRCSKHWYY